MRAIILTLWALAIGPAQYLNAQSFSSSNLPIVLITTDLNPSTGRPLDIPDEPKVPGTMKLISRPDGARNALSDQGNPAFLQYNGRIAIELRGSTSQALPKKPYGFTTLKSDNVSNNNVSLLGMPAENDWILHNLAYDPTFIRDALSYELARETGMYASRTQFCEVVVNGDYKGLYLLMEKIKPDQERVNIQKMTASDQVLPNLSGGYITKADKTTGGDPVAWTMVGAMPVPVTFIHDYPNPEDITPEQHRYIYQQFLALEQTTAANNTSPSGGYPASIDVPSFVDYMLINELIANVDAYQFSTFFHKDRGGKLRAGPVWDCNLTFGNDLFTWGFNRGWANVWQFDNGDNTGPFFWKNLFLSPPFQCRFAQRWKALSAPGQGLGYEAIAQRIDRLSALIAEAIVREKERWQVPGTHANQVGTLKYWLQARTDWMTATLGKVAPCSPTPLPSLVISRIHYNPLATAGFSSDQLEHIEITNTGTGEADVSGFYFRDLGISYQFPAGARLRPGQRVYICSNPAAFENATGLPAFGQFLRNLSNKSQKLSLANPFGDLVDYVEYKDTAPWPTEADGKGAFLRLRDLGSDNALAENWEAFSPVSAARTVQAADAVHVYPNPVTDLLHVESKDGAIQTLIISDLSGALRGVYPVNAPNTRLDVTRFAPGMYLLRTVFADGRVQVGKWAKGR